MTEKTGGIQIMRNRQKRSHKKHRKPSLNPRNNKGYFDLTAFEAMANIRYEAKLLAKQKAKEM